MSLCLRFDLFLSHLAYLRERVTEIRYHRNYLLQLLGMLSVLIEVRICRRPLEEVVELIQILRYRNILIQRTTERPDKLLSLHQRLVRLLDIL